MKLYSFEIVEKGASYLLMKQLPPAGMLEGPFDGLLLQVCVPHNYICNHAVKQVVDIEIRKVMASQFVIRNVGENPSDKRILELAFASGDFIRFSKRQYVADAGGETISVLDEITQFPKDTAVKIIIRHVDEHRKAQIHNTAYKKAYHTISIGEMLGKE
jgi:hypothetical protein